MKREVGGELPDIPIEALYRLSRSLRGGAAPTASATARAKRILCDAAAMGDLEAQAALAALIEVEEAQAQAALARAGITPLGRVVPRWRLPARESNR